MPIDFARIASAFAQVFRVQRKAVGELFEKLAESLGKRLKDARTLEQATSRFPVIAFRDEAVTLRVDASQRGALEVGAPPPSVGEHLARGGASFLDGFRQIADMIDQELILPRFATSLDRGVGVVEASVERWLTITPRHFDRAPRTASDLFGQLALGFRLLSEASHRDLGSALASLLQGRLVVGPRDGDLYQFTDQIRRARAVLSGDGATTNGGGASAGVVPEIPLSETLDTYSYELLGGMVIIGALPSFIDILLRAAVLRIKVRLLDELEGIEGHVQRLRLHVIEKVFVDFPASLEAAHHFLGGLRVVLAAHVALYANVARTYLTELLDAVVPFLQHVLEFFRDLWPALRAIPAALQPMLSYDLRWFLLTDEEGESDTVGMILVQYLPQLTLGELLDESGENVNRDLHRRLLQALKELRQDFGVVFLSSSVAHKWALALNLFNRMFPATVVDVPEAPALGALPELPNINDTLFGDGRGLALQNAVVTLRQSLDAGVGRVFDQLESSVGEMSIDLESTGARAADLGALAQYRRLARQADTVAGRVFGAEVTEQRELAAAAPTDVLAASYERWLAGGGFVLIGNVLPAFVEQMRDYWLEQVAEGREVTTPVTPTSPHILRRHARLGRVSVPRMTLHAPHSAHLDDAFAESIAGGFERAVSRAYTTGRERLLEMGRAD